MQLWTHHPSVFRLDSPGLKVYPKRGHHWKLRREGYRYPEIAAKLWEKVGTDQFIWCCTIRGRFSRHSEDVDLTEWEINAPPSTVLAFVSSPVWENLIWTRSESWEGLIIDRPSAGHSDIHALVAVPLAGAICHGQLRPDLTREQEEQAREIQRNPPDPKLAEQYDD
jgi:hypothetical protein